MSNPGSPANVGGVANNKTKKDVGNGNRDSHQNIAKHLDPVVRLESLELPGIQSVKTKKVITLSSGNKPSAGVVPVPAISPGGIDSETDSAPSPTSMNMDIDQDVVAGTPPPKIRRPSVHFAEPAVTSVVEAEPRSSKPSATSGTERTRQESGSRKHRSRKEKLVCRSESPSDLGMDTSTGGGESSTLSSVILPISAGGTSGGVLTATNAPPATKEMLGHQSEITVPIKNKGPPQNQKPVPVVTSRVVAPSSRPMKLPFKKSSVGSYGRTSSGSARRYSPIPSSSSGNFRDPVRKKKVIEIVSPRKRKMDHFHLMKTSSDPIFVRAANKPFKLKNKSRHNRLKFSRPNPNKSGSHHSGSSRIRRESLQLNSMGHVINRQLPNIPKKEPENDELPSALVNDLMWVMKEAEKVFEPRRPTQAAATSSMPHSSASVPQIDPVASTSAAAMAKGLGFGRRRVESEPPSMGYDVAPHSPSGPQSFYHLRKEIYFSPSPSYAAAGPTGRRRYSRRRHAKIHPPFDNSNCSFQGHLCPNSKVPGSQFCEKHLDKGPAAGYSHCRYMKDGRQCGNLFPTFDPSETFCEDHAYLVAKSEYDKRNPTLQPDPAKNIITKMSKMLVEGFANADSESMSLENSNPVILQIASEADVVQELPLGNFTGGLLEDCDTEGGRDANPDKPDYDALKNAGYFTTEEVIQIHISKLRKLKSLYQREKELEWLTRQHKLRYFKEGLDKLKHCGPKFTTNPYLIDKFSTELPKDYIDHQIKQYEAAKAILQTAYKADGQRGLLRFKMLKKAQELERMAKATGQKQQHDAADIYDSETDADSDSGEPRERRESSRYANVKPLKCEYNEGYAISACPNPPVYGSHFCFKHILSDPKQVQFIACGRRIGPHPQDVCKTPVLRVLEKHGCRIHAPLVLTKHKPLRRSEEELHLLGESDQEEEEVSLEDETTVLENLVSDECIGVSHLDEIISHVNVKGGQEITDTSDSEETDEESPGAPMEAPMMGSYDMDLSSGSMI